MNAMYYNNILPSCDSLVDELKRAGLTPVEYETRDGNSDIPHIQVSVNWRDFIELVQKEKTAIVFYQFLCYNVNDFLIDDNEIDESLFTVTKLKELKRKIKSYNDELLSKFDFTRPCSLSLLSFLSNNTAIRLDIEDDWLFEGEFEGTLSSRAALDSLLYSNDHERLEYEKQKQVVLRTKQDQANKVLFDFIMSDPRFEMCTTSQARREYVRDVLEPEKALHNKLLEFGVKRRFDYLSIIVDVIWKLKKNGITEFNDLVSNMMYRPERK